MQRGDHKLGAPGKPCFINVQFLNRGESKQSGSLRSSTIQLTYRAVSLLGGNNGHP